MFKELIFFESGAVFGGQIGDLISAWESSGVFSYMLPFLLIFALIFGLLTKLNIFGNAQDPNKGKMVNAIISVSIAIMALQFNMVSDFFGQIFPRMGIGLSIILLILILGGLFIPINKENNWFLTAITFVVFILIAVIVASSFGDLGWISGSSGLISGIWNQYGSLIIFVLIVIIVVFATTHEKKTNSPKTENLLSKLLGAEK
jgi:hypothetical protein